MRHLAVYDWIAEFLPVGGACCDIGSGAGYGIPVLLAAGAGTVVGIELDSEAVTYSARHYFQGDFIRANVVALPLSDDCVNLAASLQVIEHIWDAEAYLQEIARILVPGGQVVISTPNRDVFSPGLSRGQKPLNPFHVEEFDAEQLMVHLSDSGFADVRIRGLHHGPRLQFWEAQHGPIVTALVTAGVTGHWPPDLYDFVCTITSSDFSIGEFSDSQDLIATGVRRG